METIFRVLTGTAKEVETKLNNLKKANGSVCIMGLSATNETTTVVVEIFPK
tara:strand:+ start:803 stop:955 length:153 start_codon:yes stop_codon:yes gene_type:complete